MTDETEKPDENLSKPWLFKKGYDPKRWMRGAPRKPKDKKKAEELLEHLIWDVLSEDITHPITGEKIDRFRAMIRSMTTSKQSADRQAILDRIAGKIAQEVNIGGDSKLVIEIVKASDDKSADSD